MNKRMKELLAQIAGIQATAKGFMTGENKDVEKAKTELAKVTALQEEFEVEKALYEAEKAKVPDVISTADTATEKADGFVAVAKMLKNKPLLATEKALITGGTDGENNLIPTDIDYAIRELRKQYVSAKDVVTVIQTDTLTGGFNFESGTPAGLSSLTDGDTIATEDNPSFARKPFTIEFFAKLIAISNILKGAEKAGLMSYINNWFLKNAIVTENTSIFTELKSGKELKALVGWKALKTSINKDLDPSALIGGVIVTNQTGFDVLDSELDGQGRPILSVNPAEPMKKTFNGLPIVVFPDAQLANVSSKAPIFYGNLKAGCYFIEKNGLEFNTSSDFLFSRNQTALNVIEGFDVIQADTAAYIYGTIVATA